MKERTTEHAEKLKASAHRRQLCWLVGCHIQASNPTEFDRLLAEAIKAEEQKVAAHFKYVS